MYHLKTITFFKLLFNLYNIIVKRKLRKDKTNTFFYALIRDSQNKNFGISPKTPYSQTTKSRAERARSYKLQ